MRKAKLGCLGLVLFALVACCAGPMAVSMSAQGDGSSTGSGEATAAGIPSRMLAAYISAAQQVVAVRPRCRGMAWPVLAGVAMVESHHAQGRTIAADGEVRPRIIGPRLDGSGNTSVVRDTDHGAWDGDTSYDRAVGPFQLLPATFKAIGRDGNGDGKRDPNNVDDAALSAAVYLCGGGKGRDLAQHDQLDQALYSYNHSEAYVSEVMGWIRHYQGVTTTPTLAGVTGKARTVVAAALAMRGVPYSWGGGTAHGPSYGGCCSPAGHSGARIRGFDCSGLTLYAFSQVGIHLPRTAAEQAGAGRRIPASDGVSALHPGDLVFFGYRPGVDSTIHHVGIYLGGGRMVNALRPGTRVRIDPVAGMPGFAGGARLW